MDHYQVLGVSRRDEGEVIRRAYLELARRYHPDFHAGAAESVRRDHARRMQEINDAWAVLGDPVARRSYDKQLAHREDPGVARRAAREPGAVPPGVAGPPGKGWTPRAGDDRWMDDYEDWRNEGDDLPPDRPAGPVSKLVTVMPVGLFAVSLAFFGLALVMTSRALVALGAIAFAFSVALFVFLPMLAMTKGRRSR